MQAITTKYLPATNTKPSRISAANESGIRTTMSYDSALDGDANHVAAAKALCAKLNWHGRLASGATKSGYVFVFITGRDGLTLCSPYRAGKRTTVATFTDKADCDTAHKAVNRYADTRSALKNLADAVTDAKLPLNRMPRLSRALQIAQGALKE